MKKWYWQGAVWAALMVTALGAEAYTSFDLPQSNPGNMLGLAYRETDGHFFVTQEAVIDGGAGFKDLVYEFNSAGALMRMVDLGALNPNIVGAGPISAPEAGDGLFIQRFEAPPDNPEAYVPHVYKLSSDLSSITKDGVPLDLADFTGRFTSKQLGQVTDTEIYSPGEYGSNRVVVASRLDDGVRMVDLSRYASTGVGCFDRYLGRGDMCVLSVAPSWDGGFFVINEGLRNDGVDGIAARLLSFDAEGNLTGAMNLDSAVFDHHPFAVDVDQVNHRVFLSMNSQKVFMLSEAEFRAASFIPEPSTWALWGLGALALPAGVRRARRG